MVVSASQDSKKNNSVVLGAFFPITKNTNAADTRFSVGSTCTDNHEHQKNPGTCGLRSFFSYFGAIYLSAEFFKPSGPILAPQTRRIHLPFEDPDPQLKPGSPWINELLITRQSGVCRELLTTLRSWFPSPTSSQAPSRHFAPRRNDVVVIFVGRFLEDSCHVRTLSLCSVQVNIVHSPFSIYFLVYCIILYHMSL